jgi:hypothetical protein
MIDQTTSLTVNEGKLFVDACGQTHGKTMLQLPLGKVQT